MLPLMSFLGTFPNILLLFQLVAKTLKVLQQAVTTIIPQDGIVEPEFAIALLRVLKLIQNANIIVLILSSLLSLKALSLKAIIVL